MKLSRRNFLINLGIVTVGTIVAPYVPKTIYFDVGKNLKVYDPVLIPLLRRSIPSPVAFEICGVQPMELSSTLIFKFNETWEPPIRAEDFILCGPTFIPENFDR